MNRLIPALPAAILLAAIALMAYANTFDAPFLFDDLPNIAQNPDIRVTRITPESLARVLKSRSSDRPLAFFSFAVNYYFHGYDVRGYHAVNLVIHIVTALLIFLIARLTLPLAGTESGIIPLLAAALWLANPVHTQSVTYIVQRMNSLAAMFYLLALYGYIRARMTAGGSRGRRFLFYALCLAAGLLGLASKQTAATLPVMLFLYEWFFFQKLDRAWLKKQLPWIGLATVAGVVLVFFLLEGNPLKTIVAGYAKQKFTLGQRLLTQPLVITYYVSLLLFPHPSRLAIDYDFPLSATLTDPLATVPALAALLVLFTGAVYASGKHRLLSFAVLWFLVNLAVESSFLPLELIYEHRTYLPSVFPVIGLAWLVCSRVRPRAAAVILLSAAIVVCGFWTYRRNTVWTGPILLWRDAVTKAPERGRLHNNLGFSLAETGRYQEAIACYETALRLDPDNTGAYNNLGLAYEKLGDLDKALACYTRALQQATLEDIICVSVFRNIGELLLRLNRPQEAATFFNNAIELYPRSEHIYVDLGIALMQLGRTDEAIASNNRALALNPYLEQACNNLGNAWYRKGDMDRAADAFRQALAINPSYPEAADNLKKIEGVMNRYGNAIDQLQTAARQQPDNSQAAYQAGMICQKAGMTDRAVFWYEQALSLDPGRPVYLNALAESYATAGNIKAAAETFERLARQVADNPTVFYNLACLYARLNEKDKAVASLKEAVNRGYDRWDHLKEDKDLKNISDTDYYKSLVR